MRRALALATCALMLVVAACQSGGNTPAGTRQTPAIGPSPWVQVDLPGVYSGWRAAAYDPSRDCLWIVTRVWADTDHVTLTRLNLADHSVVQTGLQLDANDWEGAWVVVDAQDKVWMAWGKTVYAYEANTNSLTRFVMPAFERFGLHPSLYSMDGRMHGLARDSSGELWMVYSRVAAIFGFNPSLGKWDRVIKMPWFPYGTIAFPRPGVLTINGSRSPDGKAIYYKFAEVDVATGRLREYSADIAQYTLADAHTVVFTDWRNNLGRLDLDTGEITILDGEAGIDLGASQFGGGDGYVWFAMGTGVGKVDVASGVMTQYEFPAVVPTTPVPNTCVPPHVPLDSGRRTCPLPCPSGVASCIPKPWIPSAQVYALTFDGKGNIWAVTDQAGSQESANSSLRPNAALRPVMELRIGAG